MRIDILTLFPEVFHGPLEASIIGRAVRENLSFVLPALAHAVESLRGRTGDHRAAGANVERLSTGEEPHRADG